MILSQHKLEEIAASTTKDFNRFFFGDEADKPDRSALPTPIDQFAKNYLGLRVSFARLSPDGSICGVTAYADTEYKITELGITRTLALKRNQVILDESFIRSGNVQRLCAKRRFTLAHECAHQILFQLESEEVKASCEMRYSARTAYTPRELKTREDWNEWQANVLGAAILLPQKEVDLAMRRFAETPLINYEGRYPDKKKFSNMSEKISWETVMVYNILKNLVYTGTLVSRKMKSCGVGSKKRVVNEPIIVEGTHEAIISKEDFELAQKVIRGGGRNPTRKQHDYPLKGLVRCGNCKRAMTRRKNKAGIRYFQCIHSVNNGNTDCPVGRSFPEMDIEKVVFHALTQFLALAQKEAIQNREVGDLRKSAIKECADKIRTLQKQNEQHKASKLRLYEKYAAGSITKEAYIQQKAAADVKIAENDGVIQRSHERMKELDSETACSDEKLDAVCDQYADCKALTYELTHAFISAVYIYDLDNIEIVWKFKDFLTTSEGEAK